MKRLYMTPCDGFKPHTKDDVLDHWNKGGMFKAYQGPKFNNTNIQAMRILGCEDICFVWQRADKTVHHHILEIK